VAALRPPDPPLTDGVVTVRAWRDDDLPALVAAFDDPELSRWLPDIPYPYTENDGRAFLGRLEEGYRDGRFGLAVVSADRGGLLGGIGLRREQEHRAELGYWVRRDARGRGVATLALRLVSRWAFDELGFHRLQLHTDVENVASQRVAERAGYTREGVLRAWLVMHGEPRDHVLFSLLSGDV
jgi:RimJ/RimL family protein N-acetyltransferase